MSACRRCIWGLCRSTSLPFLLALPCVSYQGTASRLGNSYLSCNTLECSLQWCDPCYVKLCHNRVCGSARCPRLQFRCQSSSYRSTRNIERPDKSVDLHGMFRLQTRMLTTYRHRHLIELNNFIASCLLIFNYELTANGLCWTAMLFVVELYTLLFRIAWREVFRAVDVSASKLSTATPSPPLAVASRTAQRPELGTF